MSLSGKDYGVINAFIEQKKDNKLINISVVNGVLNLKTNKNQFANITSTTTLVLPSVSNFTEIHLFFKANSDLTLILPSNVKWQNTPVVKSGYYYEFIFTYVGEWLGGVVDYV